MVEVAGTALGFLRENLNLLAAWSLPVDLERGCWTAVGLGLQVCLSCPSHGSCQLRQPVQSKQLPLRASAQILFYKQVRCLLQATGVHFRMEQRFSKLHFSRVQKNYGSKSASQKHVQVFCDALLWREPSAVAKQGFPMWSSHWPWESECRPEHGPISH